MQGQYTRSWAGGEQSAPGSVRPRFYMDPVQDELASAREGRPIFREIERVEIFLPGNPYTMPVENVTDDHRQRWAREYEMFRQGIEQTADGTPLSEWPVLNRAQVLEMKGLQIQTIEEVANLSDIACQRAMGLTQLRTKARAYLDDAVAMALTQQLSAETENQRSHIASLERQVAELGDLVQKLHGELMGMRNAPHPVATAIPGMMDPMQQAQAFQAASTPREDPRSSLTGFVDEKRKPGRPRKATVEAA